MSYQPLLPSVNTPTPAWTPSRLGWLGLASFPHFGPATLRKLQKETNQNGQAAWELKTKQLEQLIQNKKTLATFLNFRRQVQLDTLAEQLDKSNIQFLLSWEQGFSKRLLEIHDPPAALFIRGSLESLQAPCLAIVGTRSMTSYGKRITQELATKCAEYGITVISGLALGIDGVAHQATVNAQGQTIAVLGSGLDDSMLYPRQHVALAKQIIASGGGLISESGQMYDARPFDFPLRNRLISGLAQAVLVTEAAEKSGSLITAHLAAEQGRDVLTIPGPINSNQSTGTNRLLKQGAIPCTKIEDILETLHLCTSDPRGRPSSSRPHIPEDPDCASLLAAITEPLRADELARKTGQPIAEISRRLTLLELQGYIVSPDRKTYSRTTSR